MEIIIIYWIQLQELSLPINVIVQNISYINANSLFLIGSRHNSSFLQMAYMCIKPHIIGAVFTWIIFCVNFGLVKVLGSYVTIGFEIHIDYNNCVKSIQPTSSSKTLIDWLIEWLTLKSIVCTLSDRSRNQSLSFTLENEWLATQFLHYFIHLRS